MDSKRKDYFQTFETPHGKRVLDDLRKLSGLMSNVINKDSQGRLDPWMENRKLGRKDILIHIYTKLKQKPYESKGDTNE